MVEILRWESSPDALGCGWEGDDSDGGSSQRPESREKRALGGRRRRMRCGVGGDGIGGCGVCACSCCFLAFAASSHFWRVLSSTGHLASGSMSAVRIVVVVMMVLLYMTCITRKKSEDQMETDDDDDA